MSQRQTDRHMDRHHSYILVLYLDRYMYIKIILNTFVTLIYWRQSDNIWLASITNKIVKSYKKKTNENEWNDTKVLIWYGACILKYNLYILWKLSDTIYTIYRYFKNFMINVKLERILDSRGVVFQVKFKVNWSLGNIFIRFIH